MGQGNTQSNPNCILFILFLINFVSTFVDQSFAWGMQTLSVATKQAPTSNGFP
jgi:hypothetical protein